MAEIILPISVFVGVAALVAGIGLMMGSRKESGVEDRLAMLTGSTSGKQAKETLLKGSVLAQPLEASQNMMWARLAQMGNLPLLMDQADVTMSPGQFFGISAIMAVVGMFIPVVAGLHPSIVLPMGLMLAVLPFCWLLFKRRRRLKQFAKQLPEALELISRALRRT